MYKSYIQALITAIAIALSASAPAIPAGPRDPFPQGPSMATQGAIADPTGQPARDPSLAAALYRDTLRYGASFSAVSYHGGGSVSQYALGGFAVLGSAPAPVTCKLSLAHLDALGIYYERTAALSVGGLWGSLSGSIEATLYQSGLRTSLPAASQAATAPPSRATASLGATLHLAAARVNADVSLSGLTFMPSGALGFDPPLTLSARLCTVRNRYGVQGAAVVFTPGGEQPLRIALAQEYRIGKAFAVAASIASNPTAVGFGITAYMRPVGVAAAAVNHPELGWSRGVAVEYYR